MARHRVNEYGVRVQAPSAEDVDERDQEDRNAWGDGSSESEDNERHQSRKNNQRDDYSSEHEQSSVEDNGEESRTSMRRLNDLSKEDLVKSLHKSLLSQDSLKDEVASLKVELNSSLKVRRKRRTREAAQPLTSAELEIALCGKKFTLMFQLWMPDETEIFGLELEEDYDPADRFRNKANILQGVLHELQEILPHQLTSARLEEEERFSTVFLAAQSALRSTCANRVRQCCHEIFGTEISLLMTDSSEHPTLLNLLDYDPDNKTYSLFPPLLYEDSETCAKGTLFLNGAIIKTLKSCLFGPASLKQDKAPSMTSKSNAKLWGLKTVTPGMIAGAAILARWAISKDIEFQIVGAQTGFNYAEAFDYYKKYIIVALNENKASGRQLLAVYNKHLFSQKITEPESPSGAPLHTEMDAMMAELMAEGSEDTEGAGSGAGDQPGPAGGQPGPAGGPTSLDLNPNVDPPQRTDNSNVQLAEAAEAPAQRRPQATAAVQPVIAPPPTAAASPEPQTRRSRSFSEHSTGSRPSSTRGTKRHHDASTQQRSSSNRARKTPEAARANNSENPPARQRSSRRKKK